MKCESPYCKKESLVLVEDFAHTNQLVLECRECGRFWLVYLVSGKHKKTTIHFEECLKEVLWYKKQVEGEE